MFIYTYVLSKYIELLGTDTGLEKQKKKNLKL